MQILTIIKAACLSMAFTGKLSIGSPVDALNPRADIDASLGSELLERQSPYYPIITGLPGVLEYASETLAYQIVGAANTKQQLDDLCHKVPAYLYDRLKYEGYNTTFIMKAVCDAAALPVLQTNDQIRTEVLQASSKIWVVQALTAVPDHNTLCHIFDPNLATEVGLNGTFVQAELCNVNGKRRV